MISVPLDPRDLKLLDYLQQNANISRAQLSEYCGMSEATCSRRIAALTKRGYLRQHGIPLNRLKLGLKIAVFVLVTMEDEHATKLRKFLDQLAKLPIVLSISYVSGEYDYLLHIVTTDMEAYHEFVQEFLVKDERVKRYISLFEMKSVKDTQALPLALVTPLR